MPISISAKETPDFFDKVQAGEFTLERRLGTGLNRGVSKNRGSRHLRGDRDHSAMSPATRGADSAVYWQTIVAHNFVVLSTKRRCRICVTVRLPVGPRGETMYWQANVSVATPAEPCGDKQFFFGAKFWAVKNF